MARKSNKPLEWAGFGRIVVATDADFVNLRVVLGLRDDEIAEIHRIEYLLEIALAATTTGARIDIGMSMDPDFDDATTVVATTEDLEVFHTDSFVFNVLAAIADVDQVIPGSKYVQKLLSPPLMVGTDVGISSSFIWLTADGSGQLHGQIFFTRRKATVQELNQVLLKRR